MTQRLEAEGNSHPDADFMWDDGSEHDGITKIYVRGDREGIQFIKFDYVTTGQLKDESLHGFSNQGFTQMFEIDHLKGEHLVSVDGYYNSNTKVIQGLQFKTNLKVSELIGYEYCIKFTLAVEGKKIIGFHGASVPSLTSLGAYVTWISPTRIEAQGGKGGKEWNDGADYEAVTKIHVCASRKGIQNIQFEYVDKDGHPKEGLVHGNPHGGLKLEPFEINHADTEYLLSADGYYDETSGVIQAVQFKTNIKTSELMGFYDDETDTKFSLGCHGNKIIGFHGYADKNLNSLGAYFTSLPIVKLESESNSCFLWDDGTFHGVRKVSVYYYGSLFTISCVRFEYDNGGKVETREHGMKFVGKVQEGEFVLDYPNELLTSVEGTITPLQNLKFVTSMTFKTSKGRSSPIFGNEFGSGAVKFKLEEKGCAFSGFHGRSITYGLHGLGAYFPPMLPPQDEEN